MDEQSDPSNSAAKIAPEQAAQEASDPAAHVEVYMRYVKQMLCWLDGSPTHRSSDLQRQCPKCRGKWSYERLGVELALLDKYCEGLSASEAARRISCAKNTALHHFGHFSARMQDIVATRLIENDIATSPITVGEAKSLEKALRTGNRRRREKVCRHLFFAGLSFEERMQGIFLKHIAGEVRARTEEAKPPYSRNFYSYIPDTGHRRVPQARRTFLQSCVDLARQAWRRLEARFDPNCPRPSKSCKWQGPIWVKVWEKARRIRKQAQGGPPP